MSYNSCKKVLLIISIPYEEPESPDLVLDTDRLGVQEAAEEVLRLFLERHII